MFSTSPTRLHHAGDHPRGCQFPEANTAHLEFSHESTAPPASLAAIVSASAELRRTARFNLLRYLGQDLILPAVGYRCRVKGMPSRASSSLARSSVGADVTIVTFIPCTFFTLSGSISGKIVCS